MRATALKRTLVKIGGSLLKLPDIAARVRNLMERVNGVIVVGGGEAADLVRTWDDRLCLSAVASHRVAIEAMRLNARLLTELDDQFVLVDDVNRTAVPKDGVTIIDPVTVMQRVEHRLPADQHLPATWDVTSDSIAAWLTIHCGFDELLLAKSVAVSQLPRDVSVKTLESARFVDAHFSQLAPQLPHLSWCHLAAETQSEIQCVW